MKDLSLHFRLALAMGISFTIGFVGFASHLTDVRDELRTMMLESAILRTAGPLQGAMHLTCDKNGNIVEITGVKIAGLDKRLTTCKTESRILTNSQNAAVFTPLPDGGTRLTIRPDSSEQQAVDALIYKRLRRGVTWWIALALFCAVAIYLLIRWTLHPVRKAAQLAERIGPEQTALRLPVVTLPEELRPLVSAINGGLDRLTEAYSAQTRFIADTSHALRTPLASLYLNLQSHRDSIPNAGVFEEELLALRHLVDQLLTLARCDTLAAGKQETVKISRLARQTAAVMVPLIDAQGRLLEAEIADGLEASVDEMAFTELIKIGIDNALVHGKGTITLRMSVAGKDVMIEIKDQGNGPPAEARAEVFNRFCKLSPDTRGNGLGLSIAQEIVRRYNGEISFPDTKDCTLLIRLPLRIA